ncbi:hypothetical protein ETSB_0402 [cyanobacterium endosymbiont of Epithemia turgida isolate EtSB Lake Yunoko]|nr:hypothetical protein ETSB_0402 [cyanobacterium endosymbiont of Epithemia turgida isolate EtSB Lake Yunoko]
MILKKNYVVVFSTKYFNHFYNPNFVGQGSKYSIVIFEYIFIFFIKLSAIIEYKTFLLIDYNLTIFLSIDYILRFLDIGFPVF